MTSLQLYLDIPQVYKYEVSIMLILLESKSTRRDLNPAPHSSEPYVLTIMAKTSHSKEQVTKPKLMFVTIIPIPDKTVRHGLVCCVLPSIVHVWLFATGRWVWLEYLRYRQHTVCMYVCMYIAQHTVYFLCSWLLFISILYITKEAHRGTDCWEFYWISYCLILWFRQFYFAIRITVTLWRS